nr:NF-kappa-B inhibitor delta [Anolis sagrei ordinatus]
MENSGCKVSHTNVASQTVRKLLEKKRLERSVPGDSARSLIPSGAPEGRHPAESLFPEPAGAPEGGGPTPGQTAIPEYPVGALPAWQPDASSQASFPPGRPYQHVDATNSFCLQPPAPPFGVMSPFIYLETNLYGSTGPAATEPVHGSKTAPAMDFENATTEAQTLNLYENNWPVQEMNNPCLLPPGSFPVPSAEMDPGELAQARAQIQNVELTRLLQQDEDGDMLLHLLVAQGFRPLAYAAAEMLRDCGQLDVKEHRGKTPLLVAAAANQAEIVKDLIMLGADANAVDQKGQTVLHLGATYGLPSVIEAVMMTGIPVNVEARNFEGLTPLHCAVIAHNAAFQAQTMEQLSQNHLQNLLLCIRLLLQLGADYKSQDLKSSKTLLHLAVQAANLPVIQFLLQLPGPELQRFVNMKAHGNTALHMAAGLHGHPYQEEIVRLLLHHWADPSARNLENEQPVHLLAPGPVAEQLRLLLRSRRACPGPPHLPNLS